LNAFEAFLMSQDKNILLLIVGDLNMDILKSINMITKSVVTSMRNLSEKSMQQISCQLADMLRMPTA
jgi:hypothetical protein